MRVTSKSALCDVMDALAALNAFGDPSAAMGDPQRRDEISHRVGGATMRPRNVLGEMLIIACERGQDVPDAIVLQHLGQIAAIRLDRLRRQGGAGTRSARRRDPGLQRRAHHRRWLGGDTPRVTAVYPRRAMSG